MVSTDLPIQWKNKFLSGGQINRGVILATLLRLTPDLIPLLLLSVFMIGTGSNLTFFIVSEFVALFLVQVQVEPVSELVFTSLFFVPVF